MDECANLAKCGFVQKYGEEKAIAVKGFIRMYCKGDKQDECVRKKYKQEHGAPPSDDMMPNGAMMNAK